MNDYAKGITLGDNSKYKVDSNGLSYLDEQGKYQNIYDNTALRQPIIQY